jgi:hypothetical protein
MKVLTLVSLLLVNIYAENNSSLLDVYHDDLCKVLVNTSNSIDNYFIEEKRSVSSTTHAELSSSFAMETNQAFEKDVRFRLRLNLPKIQKNLRLIFEDENNDDSLYDRTTLNDEQLIDRSYYLRLEYFKMMKDKLNMVAGAGLRIRQGHLVPYFNLRSRYDIYNDKKIKSAFYNRFRFYTDGEIEDIFEFNSLYQINSFLHLIFRNQLSYSNKDDFETLYHDIVLTKKLHKKRQLSFGVGVSSYLKNFTNYKVEYYHFHTLYHHLFYKDWFYYQVAPSVLWREENRFDVSYRLMLNFGIFFKNA